MDFTLFPPVLSSPSHATTNGSSSTLQLEESINSTENLNKTPTKNEYFSKNEKKNQKKNKKETFLDLSLQATKNEYSSTFCYEGSINPPEGGISKSSIRIKRPKSVQTKNIFNLNQQATENFITNSSERNIEEDQISLASGEKFEDFSTPSLTFHQKAKENVDSSTLRSDEFISLPPINGIYVGTLDAKNNLRDSAEKKLDGSPLQATANWSSSTIRSEESINNINIDRLLEREKQHNKTENWNKLDKTAKIQKLHAFSEKYGKENNFTDKEVKQLKKFFNDSLDKLKLQKSKDVIYNKETKEITSVPSLYLNTNTHNFSFKITDAKRVSTIKSLTPKRIQVFNDISTLRDSTEQSLMHSSVKSVDENASLVDCEEK